MAHDVYSTATYLNAANATTSSAFSFNSGWITSEGTGLNISYGENPDEQNKDPRYVSKSFKPKKKKGNLDGANDPSKRLAILKPTVVYRFIKDRFKPIERKHLEKRFNLICEILQNANITKQTALIEKIKDKFDPFIREQELLSCGINTYIHEKTLEAFVKSVKNKIIKITPIANYVRIIPKKVQKRLEEVQNKKLFDSYVVVHTDPNDTSVEKTKAEKKDPILFGLIKGSDKYYFIADWIDELCSLTISQIIETLDLEKEDYKLPEDVNQTFIDMLLND